MTMSSYTTVRSIRRFALPIITILLFISVRCFLPGNLDPRPLPSSQYDHRMRIEGRWKEIHASFGLPSLPDLITFPILSNALLASSSTKTDRKSRFDLKRKRSVEAARNLQLFFASDIINDLGIPLQQMAASFHSVALAEKEQMEEQMRGHAQIKQVQTRRGRRV